MALVGSLVVSLSATTDDFTRGMAQAQKTLKDTQTAVVSFQGTLHGLESAMVGFAARVVSVAAIGRALEGIIATGAKMETLTMAFTQLTGSSQAGAAAMEVVREKADQLGFNVLALTESYKNLIAASRDTILSGNDTADIFRAIVNASRTLQLSTEETQQALATMEQAMSRGFLTAQQLHRGFNALPGMLLALQRGLGLSTEELNRMAKEGGLLADLVLPRLARQLELELGSKADTSAQTLTASVERLKNAITEMSASIAESGLLKWLASAAEGANTLIRTFNEKPAGRTLPAQLERDLAGLPAGMDVTRAGSYQELVRLADKRREAERDVMESQQRLQAAQAIIDNVTQRLADPNLGIMGNIRANLQGIGASQSRSDETLKLQQLQERLERINAVYQETLAQFKTEVAQLPQIVQGPTVVPPTLDPKQYEDAIRLQKVLAKAFAEFDALAAESERRIALEPESKAEVLRQLLSEQQKKLQQIQGILAAPYNQGLLPLLGSQPGSMRTSTLAPGAFPGVSADRLNAALPLIEQYAPQYGLDPALVAAVAYRESRFNPSAVSPAGAQGLMQLMPGTAAGLGVTNSFDLQQNLLGGMQYLQQLMAQFNGDVQQALAAYNAGPRRVLEAGGIPQIPETQRYVRDVQATMAQLQTQGPGMVETVTRGTAGPGIAAVRDDMERLRATIAATQKGMAELANQDVFAKLLTQLQADFDRLSQFPEEFEMSQYERLNAAAATAQRVRELFARDASAARTLLAQEITAWQEILGAETARTSLRDLRQQQQQQVDGIISGLIQEKQELSMTSAELLQYRMESLNAADADVKRAVELQNTNKQLRAAGQLADFVTNTFVDLTTGSKQSFAEIARNFERMVLSMIIDTTELKKQLAGLFGKGLNAAGNILTGLLGGGTTGVGLYGTGTDASGALSAADVNAQPYGYGLEARASGGPVLAGHDYTVGEYGPERLRMYGNGGQVTPMGRSGGITVNFNISTPDAGSFQRSRGQWDQQILQVLQRAQRST